MDYDEILRTTHTMKGIASNLEFTHLQQKSAKAVDMIRAGQREEVLPVIGEIEKEYQKLSNRSRNWIKLDNKKTKMRESFEVV